MNIEIEKDDNVFLAGYLPLNIWSQGTDPDRARAMLFEAIWLFVGCMSKEGVSIPQILKGVEDVTVRYFCEYEVEKHRESVDGETELAELREIIDRMEKESIHPEISSGPPMGNEIL